MLAIIIAILHVVMKESQQHMTVDWSGVWEVKIRSPLLTVHQYDSQNSYWVFERCFSRVYWNFMAAMTENKL